MSLNQYAMQSEVLRLSKIRRAGFGISEKAGSKKPWDAEKNEAEVKKLVSNYGQVLELRVCNLPHYPHGIVGRASGVSHFLPRYLAR